MSNLLGSRALVCGVFTKIIPAAIAFELALPDLGGRRLYFLQRVDRGPSSWECVSTDIASIARLLPECAYAPGYVPLEIKVQPLERPWVALYTGTVGGSPVVALFWQVTQTTSTARDPAVPVEGLYYYRRHALTLALRRAADLRGLAECPESFNGEDACPRPSGTWRVDVTEDRVTGSWRASSDAPSRVPDPDDITWVFYPTIEGLAVAPQVYNEAERGCRTESVIVPWADVKKTVIGERVVP
jgi:hypothetical protein